MFPNNSVTGQQVNINGITYEFDGSKWVKKSIDALFTAPSEYSKKDLSNVKDEDILNKLKNVDGDESGLDADLLRGLPADFTCNIDSNGYTKLPNGLIIQWGKAYIGSDDSNSHIDKTIIFPISFPNAGFSVIANPDKGANENYGAITCYISNISASSFDVGIDSSDSDQKLSNDIYLHFIAIGY